MKLYCLLVLFLLPVLTFAQLKVILPVNQPEEFEYSLIQSEITVNEGDSVNFEDYISVFGGSGEYSFLWSPSVPLTDSTSLNSTVFPKDTTDFLLTATDKLGCSFELGFKINVIKNINGIQTNQLAKSFAIEVFPNPNSGEFSFKTLGSESREITINFLDIHGKLILNKTIENFTGFFEDALQLNLASGIYSLRAISGNEVVSRLIIIQ